MQLTKRVKRRTIIKALRKEKLRRGEFFHGEEEGCKVCAVGAVLRFASFEKWMRNHGFDCSGVGGTSVEGDARGNWKDGLKIKDWMGSLSSYFEARNSKEKCIAFVKKYFPKQIKITIFY